MPTRSSSSARACLRRPCPRRAVKRHRLRDLGADRLDRVERVHRALEDHRDVVPAVRAHRLLPTREDVLAVEAHLARTRRVGGQETHDREDRRRLAAARLADEARSARPPAARSVTPCTAWSSPPPGSSNQTFRSSTLRGAASSFGVELPARGPQPEPAHREVADAQARVERVLERLPEERAAEDDERRRRGPAG